LELAEDAQLLGFERGKLGATAHCGILYELMKALAANA
jgi:hypothetical protein